MPYSRPQLVELSRKIGRSWRTLQYWAAQGCNLNDPESVKAFLEAKELRKTNVQKARERARNRQDNHREDGMRTTGSSTSLGNGEGPVASRKGAAAALERLEAAEESAHRRLEAALASGDRFRIQDAQDFWLKCSEVLRRLDLAVELARRDAEEQVPKRLACEVATAISDWLRISFMIFLSSECQVLMGIRDTNQ
jgi:hypothetical protein